MLRPRHRVKSKLIWKMLAVAALVNVLVWPVLVRLGMLARIREERLIAVSLVSLPPPPKPSDALGPAPPPLPVAAHPPRVVRTSEARPRPVVTRPAAVTPPNFAARPPTVPRQAPDALTAERALLASLPKHPAPIVVVPRPSRPPLSAPIPQSNTAPATKETDERRAARLLLAARRARAARLEEQGHLVALQIADTRAHTAQASAPPPSAPGAAVGDHANDWAEALPAPEVQVPAAPTPVKPPRLRPAVAVSKTSPEIPVSLQNSAWHATFRGEFVIHKDGSTTVKMLSSTGFPILDKRALEAARHWKFRPATANGAPVTSTQQFEMAFNVRPMP